MLVKNIVSELKKHQIKLFIGVLNVIFIFYLNLGEISSTLKTTQAQEFDFSFLTKNEKISQPIIKRGSFFLPPIAQKQIEIKFLSADFFVHKTKIYTFQEKSSKPIIFPHFNVFLLIYRQLLLLFF